MKMCRSCELSPSRERNHINAFRSDEEIAASVNLSFPRLVQALNKRAAQTGTSQSSSTRSPFTATVAEVLRETQVDDAVEKLKLAWGIKR